MAYACLLATRISDSSNDRSLYLSFAFLGTLQISPQKFLRYTPIFQKNFCERSDNAVLCRFVTPAPLPLCSTIHIMMQKRYNVDITSLYRFKKSLTSFTTVLFCILICVTVSGCSMPSFWNSSLIRLTKCCLSDGVLHSSIVCKAVSKSFL